jgi:hypothetical protein
MTGRPWRRDLPSLPLLTAPNQLLADGLDGGGESGPTRGAGEQREAQMCVNRAVKVSIALVLGGAAVVAAAQSGTPALGAQLGARPVSAAAGDQGTPDAVPPILAPLRPSELAAMRRAEAQQW